MPLRKCGQFTLGVGLHRSILRMSKDCQIKNICLNSFHEQIHSFLIRFDQFSIFVIRFTFSLLSMNHENIIYQINIQVENLNIQQVKQHTESRNLDIMEYH